MNSTIMENWFMKKSLSQSTQSLYTLGLKEYCNLIDKSPEELLDEAEDEEDKGLRMRRRKIETYFLKFKKYLENSKKAPQTIKVYISAVKSFYQTFDIEIPNVPTKVNDICLEKNDGRLLTRKDLQKMIEVAPIRDKAIIYLMSLSGMSQAEVRKLTIKKFLESVSQALDKQIETIEELFDHENEIEEVVLTLQVTREKVHYRYTTFIPPEVSRNIILYLKDRVYGRNERVRIKKIDSELFVNFNGNKLTKQGVASNFKRIGMKVGFKKEAGSYAFWRSHGLRKYFISTIINNTGDHVLADYLVGHKIDPVKRAYWKADPEKLKENYLEVLPYLSIDEVKVKTVRSEEFKLIMEDSKKREKEFEEFKMNSKMLEEKIKVMERLLENSEYQEDKKKFGIEN